MGRSRGSTCEGELLTAEEVARLLNVKPTQVYRLARCGELPYLRLGHYLRFPPDLLERLIEKKGSGEW